MSIRSLLKSPSFLGGAGLASAGGVGAGGWQIYEAADPTVDRSLTGRGFTYNPAQTLEEPPVTHAKFQWNNWGCVDRLFPGLEIKHDVVTGASHTASEPASTLAPTTAEDGNDFITCAMMRLQRVTLDSNFQNKIYFKSEVAVKGENYAWVMWTGLSTLPEKVNNAYAGALNFLHKLLLLSKEKDEWKIQKGYGWFDFFEQTLSISKFVITTPFEEWFSPKKPRGYLDSGEEGFPEIREWAGVAEISNSANARTLIDSIAIYKNGAEYAEFWGNGGKFKDTSQGLSGYNTAALEYVDGVGWRGTEQRDISSDLNTWYGSFVKDKKVVWSNLADRCNSWSKKRNRKVSASEDGLRLLCYKEPTKPS